MRQRLNLSTPSVLTPAEHYAAAGRIAAEAQQRLSCLERTGEGYSHPHTIALLTDLGRLHAALALVPVHTADQAASLVPSKD